jgi:uncharacterized membrane protein
MRGGSSTDVPDGRPLVAVVLALGLASALCVSLVEVRGRYSHDSFYRFLDWNLFLAWLPLVFALAAQACAQRRLRLAAAALGVLWLLFFPNAPYLLTDFIHLGASSTTPLWYDGLMLSAFAWTALLLGFVSLFVMQALWRNAVGSVAAWAAVVGALALASVGIYLGRYVGFNSWDALLHPVRVAHVLNAQGDNPLHHPRLTGSLVVLTCFLTAAYAVFYSLAGLRLATGRDEGASSGRA